MSPKESVLNEKAIQKIREEVEKEGVRGFAKKSGLSPSIITRYMQGKIGEPSTATLQKLAVYFDVPVPWLRGDFANMSYEGARKYKRVLDSGKKSGWVGEDTEITASGLVSPDDALLLVRDILIKRGISQEEVDLIIEQVKAEQQKKATV